MTFLDKKPVAEHRGGENMTRRRSRSSISMEQTQDSGKDFFAYMFIMITVFSFMLLLTNGEMQKVMSGQNGPERPESAARSTLATVSFEKIGKLVKKDDQMLLLFGKHLYHPRRDLNRLQEDGRIVTITEPDGHQKKMIYIEEKQASSVLLSEYLSAFQYLSNHGISVAFAERVM